MFKADGRRLRGRLDRVRELPDGILSCHHFSRQMDRERMRSDRSNCPFSLLTLTFATKLDAAALATIAHRCHQRLRLTDDVGMLDEARIGVVLPDTPAAGAQKVADDLRRLLHDLPKFDCRVFTYPSDESDWGGKRWEKETRVATVESPVMSHVAASDSLNHQESPCANAQPMNSFFLDRLPTWKRVLDLVLACGALVLLMPLLLLIALFVKLSSKGPVFYSQQRDGQAGQAFSIYKFRTMVVNADALKSQLRAINEQDGPAFKLKNDPRVTTFGRLLRRTCLDELPQLMNVIKGDMSIVGPRPMCIEETKECTQWQRRRLDVTPGLTCIWQVRGGTKVTFAEWMRMDLHYARSRTLIKDLQLIALTIPAIARRDGVY